MRRAFTLIEMLVVLAVMAVLTALLMPTLARARETARRQACASQLHQVGLGFSLYVQDNEDLPPRLSVLSPTYADAALFICPSDPVRGQLDGNDSLEGRTYLPSGVSLEYFPRWVTAHERGWWPSEPPLDRGRWDEMTPLAGCPWHWAKNWDSTRNGNDDETARGWEVVLTRGGAVKRARVELMKDFSPSQLR
jgi:prepilin-type N-terminal cleavage/methylation domain-containing protein